MSWAFLKFDVRSSMFDARCSRQRLKAKLDYRDLASED